MLAYYKMKNRQKWDNIEPRMKIPKMYGQIFRKFKPTYSP